MRRAHFILLAGLSIGAYGQAAVSVSPRVASDYAKAAEKAVGEQGHKRAEALAKLAELDFDYVHSAVRAGRADALAKYLSTMEEHVGQAMTLLQAESVLGEKDGMKRVEQSLQRIGYNLQDLIHQGGLGGQAQVKTVAEHIANQRTQVLNWMFSPQHTTMTRVAVRWQPRAGHQARRDPLTRDEADQLRDTAENLDKRVELLAEFAAARLERFEKVRTASQPAPDRETQLYALLRQYAAILPELNNAMDDVADAKQPNGKPEYNVGKVAKKLIAAEAVLLAKLEHIQTASSPDDLAGYHFELQNCLDATRDSIENAKQDAESGTDLSRRTPRAEATHAAA